jgi:hypothetical protein
MTLSAVYPLAHACMYDNPEEFFVHAGEDIPKYGTHHFEAEAT